MVGGIFWSSSSEALAGKRRGSDHWASRSRAMYFQICFWPWAARTEVQRQGISAFKHNKTQKHSKHCTMKRCYIGTCFSMALSSTVMEAGSVKV